jgi:hypothetical protein
MVSMNCRRARHLLFDFFDGSGNETLRAEVDRHLGECGDCERYASEMTRGLALLRRAPVEPLDETFNWKVKLAIHRERNAALARAHSTGAWVRSWNARYVMSSALAFGAVLVAGALWLHSGGGPAPAELSRAGSRVTQKADEPAHSAPTSRRSGVAAPGALDRSRLVSTGPANGTRSGAAPAGAIDRTEAEARIDSLIDSMNKADLTRMSPRERQRYVQHLEMLRQFVQSQQSAPAQR